MAKKANQRELELELEQRVKESERVSAERKRIEEALRESEEKYRQVVERTSDGIAIIQDKVVTYVNPGLAKLSGYTEDEIIGTEFTRYIHPDELPKVADHYKRRMAGENVPSIYETIFLRTDGSKLYAEVNAVLINYQGRPADLVIARDITERKQAEDALRKAHEELYKFSQELERKVQERTEELREKSNQLATAERLAALGEMANRIAHELRNPLTVIGGFARRMCEKMPDNDPNRKYLEIILAEVMDLEKKISEIVRIEDEE